MVGRVGIRLLPRIEARRRRREAQGRAGRRASAVQDNGELPNERTQDTGMGQRRLRFQEIRESGIHAEEFGYDGLMGGQFPAYYNVTQPNHSRVGEGGEA